MITFAIMSISVFAGPMSFEAAAQMEKDFAEDLPADGYTVAGGTGSTALCHGWQTGHSY